jgi:hypothetical protein
MLSMLTTCFEHFLVRHSGPDDCVQESTEVYLADESVVIRASYGFPVEVPDLLLEVQESDVSLVNV